MEYGWSLDKIDWDRFSEVCKVVGAGDWRKVVLDKRYSHGVPDDSAGVYMICTRPSEAYAGLFSDLYSALYIGKATVLRDRFMHHCKTPKERLGEAKTLFNHKLDFWYRKARLEDINVLEGALIDCLRPSVNERREAIRVAIRNGIRL